MTTAISVIITNLKQFLSIKSEVKTIYYYIFLILVFKTDLIKNLNNEQLKYHDQNQDLITYIKYVQSYFSENYKIFNLKIDIDDKTLLDIYKSMSTFDECINYHEVINEVFKILISTENLLDLREYIKYYNNPLLTDWIYKLIDKKDYQDDKKSIFDGNIKINSYLDLFKQENKFGLQTNDDIYEIILIQNFIKNKFKINQIVNTDILSNSIKLNNELFNLIVFDFPNDKHNVVYTQCCEKIKKYKIRGTNSTCLLLQLITSCLNINGEAILIIPETILFNDSKQVIETRTHLFKNFEIEKIIHIDQSLYYSEIDRDLKSISNTMKNCILKIINTGHTNKITVSKIRLNENQIVENHIVDINNVNDKCSFYYKDYIIKNKGGNAINYKQVSEIFNLDVGGMNINTNDTYLILNKTFNNKNSSIRISKIDNLDDKRHQIFISVKEEYSNDQTFYKYYLEYLIGKNPDHFYKRNNNQFDVSLISACQIPILSITQQNTICSYMVASKNIVNANNNNINLYNNMKNSVLENIPTTKLTTLNEIADLVEEQTNKKLISILRNSISVGEVSLYQGKLNNNAYYLLPKNNNFILEYMYYYLKYKELLIKDMSKLTQQNNLIKSNLLSLEIPDINHDSQKEIVNICLEFDNNINVLKLNNNIIENKNIFDIIKKINSYI